MKIQVLCFFVLILASAASSQNTKCPFQYLYHLGDGVTDVGNSVLVRPSENSIPATRLPYGITFPGSPNGRWSDGLIDFDFAAADFGFPVITPYLSKNATSSNGVIFSVARSPVLDHKFFTSRGIKLPSYAVSLRAQLRWFKTYLKSVCSTKKECANILGDSLVLLGDIEGNDIGYALSQGKSIEEVKTYIPFITRAQIDVAREFIKMGAMRVIIPGNAPLGCYPYILTTMSTNGTTTYDDLGCLKSVNDLITMKNNDLQQAINNLRRKFPNVTIFYGAFGDSMLSVLRETYSGPNRNITLKACCGIGGKYNYDNRRFCGSKGVPVCPNPGQYIFWDGLHLTHEASFRIEQIAIQDALVSLNCTSQSSTSM